MIWRSRARVTTGPARSSVTVTPSSVRRRLTRPLIRTRMLTPCLRKRPPILELLTWQQPASPSVDLSGPGSTVSWGKEGGSLGIPSEPPSHFLTPSRYSLSENQKQPTFLRNLLAGRFMEIRVSLERL